jgi:hypothetical protein
MLASRMKSVLLNPSDYKNILFIQQLVNENLNATDSKKHVHYNVTQPDGSKAPFMTYTMTNEDTDFTGFFSAGVYTLDGIRALCRNFMAPKRRIFEGRTNRCV